MMKKTLISLVLSFVMTSSWSQSLQLRADNIEEIIAELTIEEKASLVIGTGMATSSRGPVIGATSLIVPGAAGTTTPIKRLGIPAVVLSDGPAGIRISPSREFDSHTYYCTHFPIGTCLASSWNPIMVSELSQAMGEEGKAYGVDALLAPGMNIMRNPLCGRNYEYYSEDPVLAGLIAAAYVNGIHRAGIGATLKHFAFNNQETMRMGNDARVGQRAARELYLRPFQIALANSNPWMVMSAYNKINGVMTSESKDLLQTILRDEWGYKGLVVTDWYGGKDPARGGKADRVANMKAWNSLIEPGQASDITEIVDAVKSGMLDEHTLDDNVRLVLQMIVKTNRFAGYQNDNRPDLEAHANLVRKLSPEGFVLLKNQDVLPFTNKQSKVALFGCAAYRPIPGGSGSGNVNRAYTSSLVEGMRENGCDVNDQLKTIYVNHLKAWDDQEKNKVYQWYERVPPPAEYLPTESKVDSIALMTDVAVVMLSRLSGEGSDRTMSDYELSHDELTLLQRIYHGFHGLNKKVVVVLNVGGAMETEAWQSMADAILVPWQSGQEIGRATADVICGKSYPSGKLPMTWAEHVEDHLSTANFPIDVASGTMGLAMNKKKGITKNVDFTNYDEGIFVGYRYFDTFHKSVAYPFGYGLSYTTFAYTEPSIKTVGDQIEVSVKVANVGKMSGKDIVQLYVSAPKSRLQKPLQELKAFVKTRELKAGESELVTMKVNKKDLASFNEQKCEWVTDAGKYEFRIGKSSQDIQCRLKVKVKGSITKVNKVF